MISKAEVRKSIHQDEEGATLVEFGIIAVPFLFITMGAFDLGYQMYIRTMLEGTLAEVARKVSVENPNIDGSAATLEERIEDAIKERVGYVAREATYDISIKNFTDFSGVGKPEKLTTDVNGNGEYDDADGDCWQDLNGNGLYDDVAGRDGVGGASDVMHYNVQMTVPRLFPTASMIGAKGEFTVEATTLFKTQPFAAQQQPDIECGEPAP